MNYGTDMYNSINYYCSVTAGKEWGNFLAMDSHLLDSHCLGEIHSVAILHKSSIMIWYKNPASRVYIWIFQINGHLLNQNLKNKNEQKKKEKPSWQVLMKPDAVHSSP